MLEPEKAQESSETPWKSRKEEESPQESIQIARKAGQAPLQSAQDTTSP